MRKLKITLIVFALFIVSVASYYLFFNKSETQSAYTGPLPPPIPITYANMAQMLTNNPIIQALPEDSTLLLRFYNFNSGEREWEKSYVMKKADVKEGMIDNADLTLTLSSAYLPQLTNQNFCGMIQAAKANGDLGVESSLSTAGLLWKFKSIAEYRSCLGF